MTARGGKPYRGAPKKQNTGRGGEDGAPYGEIACQP